MFGYFLSGDYIALIILGAVFGAVVFVMQKRGERDWEGEATVICIILAVSIGASILYSSLLSSIIERREEVVKYRGNFSFFNTFFIFIGLLMLYYSIFKKQRLNIILRWVFPSLMVFLFFGRIGCLTSGCCGTAFAAVEACAAIILCVLSLVFKKINFTYYFIPCYCIYRFITEFYKEVYFFEKLGGGLTSLHYWCFAVFAIYIAYFIKQLLKYISLKKCIKTGVQV